MKAIKVPGWPHCRGLSFWPRPCVQSRTLGSYLKHRVYLCACVLQSFNDTRALHCWWTLRVRDRHWVIVNWFTHVIMSWPRVILILGYIINSFTRLFFFCVLLLCSFSSSLTCIVNLHATTRTRRCLCERSVVCAGARALDHARGVVGAIYVWYCGEIEIFD